MLMTWPFTLPAKLTSNIQAKVEAIERHNVFKMPVHLLTVTKAVVLKWRACYILRTAAEWSKFGVLSSIKNKTIFPYLIIK